MKTHLRAASVALTACALLALGAGCSHTSGGSEGGFAAQAVEELTASGFGDYLGVQQPSSSDERDGWTEYFFDPAEEGAVCLTGKPFQVNVHRGTSDQVLLYLQGGGACWDYLTCYVLGTAYTSANGAVQSGIIDLDDPANPFKDWNIVYVPYCDGSVFTGDATVDYNGNRTFHHGLRNLSVGVDAMLRAFPDPSRIVVAGSSAGGYGTFAGYGVTRVAYPDTPILIFNDSGPGLQNLDASQDVKDRTANWDFTKRIPPSCTECAQQYTYLIDWSLDRDSELRTAMYSYQQDGVISFFIDLDGPAYQSLLLSVTGDVHARNPERFERYFPQGTTHTVLLSPEFYTQRIDGVSLLDWTNDFLADGPGWVDTIE
ncbi:pectinacetylesterase family protein [Candidatus Binatia bacterium]|nr:pectinacetylesterase family protein [Candidatus Binatia bacterium]